LGRGESDLDLLPGRRRPAKIIFFRFAHGKSV
jgi:hypothetical protein